MSWVALLPIILQYGLPVAELIFQKVTSKAPVQSSDFAELRALAQQSAKERMQAALVAASIPLDDPKAVALLAAVS